MPGTGGELICLKDKQVLIVKPFGLPVLQTGHVYELGLIRGNREFICLKDGQVLIVRPVGLPALQLGEVYEIWSIRGNTPVAAGVCDSSDGQVAVAADISQYQALAFTVESGPLGSPSPMGENVIVTPL